jgi:uncharacterized protein
MPVMIKALSDNVRVAPEAWDRLANGHFYSTHAWLSFSGAAPGAVSGAAVRHGKDKLVAAVPFAELTAPPMPLYRWNDVLSSFDLPLLPSRGLLVGPRQGYQTHFLVSEEASASSLIADLVDDLRGLHTDGGQIHERACVVMYLTTSDALAIGRAGVRALPVLLGADAWLKIPPGGWSAWLASLTSKQRVKKIRKEVRRFREAGYEIKRMPLAECYSKLALAAAATQVKYGHGGSPDDYLAALRRYVDGMGPAAKVAVCSRRGDKPVGFCIYFIWGDTIFLRWCGFDYQRLVNGAAEYFNLLYYSQIEFAAECGARWIHAGIKSAEAKARRGAELRPLWLVDLAEDSVFTRASDQVRWHNRRSYQRLAQDSQTAPSLVDQEAWQAFL